eukprot:1158018-Pelagomonas_calceolata.AAC.1
MLHAHRHQCAMGSTHASQVHMSRALSEHQGYSIPSCTDDARMAVPLIEVKTTRHAEPVAMLRLANCLNR